MATNTTKQYLKNYDHSILYPYTILDCILADEESSLTGTDAIVSSILSKDDMFVYEKVADHTGDQYIHQYNLNGENLHMLGMYNDGERNSFIKMHAISDDETAANQYLGADGAVHTIGNGSGDPIDIDQSNLRGLYNNAVNNEWFEGSVIFDSSSCSISLVPRLNDEDFYVSAGELRVRTADHVKQAQLLVDKDNELYNVGNRKPQLISFENGIPVETALQLPVGTGNKLMYLNKNGEFTNSSSNVGGFYYSISNDTSTLKGFMPIYMLKGEFVQYDDKDFALGDLSIWCMNKGVVSVNEKDKGSNFKPVYVEKGIIKEFTKSINGEASAGYGGSSGEGSFYPIGLTEGSFVKCAAVGDTGQAVYVNSSGKLEPCKALDVSNFAKGKASAGLSILTSTGTENNWTSISEFFSNTNMEKAKLSFSGEDKKKAQVLLARPENEMKLYWEDFSESVEITSENPDNTFYLTGVYINNDVHDNDNEQPTPEEDALFNSYIDGTNSLAKKLQVAASATVATSGVNITGIYFKNNKLYQTSDEKLKTFVNDTLDIDFDNLATIKKGVFYWKDDKKQKLDIGVTAQSLEKYFPEIVDENNGVKTVSYSKLGVIALAAVDKLHLRVKELEKEVKELKEKLESK